MTDFTALLLPDRGQPARMLHIVEKSGLDRWLAGQPARVRAGVTAARFDAAPNALAILPGDEPEAWSAAIGIEQGNYVWALAGAATRLPEGSYRLVDRDPGNAALGWLLAQHRFDRYRSEPDSKGARVLLTREAARIDETVRLAGAVALVRDLVDTPSGDMGPAELAEVVRGVAGPHGAQVTEIGGETLRQGFPMIHAVGRAAAPHRGPRLIQLDWGDAADPALVLVGKGVCFDSGGLDIKPSAGMLLMKKDMGGAAHALALAGLVMAARLPVRLKLLIPAVENAISADAFRPGDVLRSRQGLHVEIGNTDAEGRLILADALALASEADPAPALILDFATLTGAARVALGPELPALFCNDDALAADLERSAAAVADPLWRLPLWQPYADMLKSDLADINNAGSGGFAGAITAALFLERFVPRAIPWAHLDTFAWNANARPGRPKGGEALGLRAAWAMLGDRFGGG